jgi:hypothetical protein
MLRTTLSLAAIAAALGAGVAASTPLPVLEANVVAIQRPAATVSYPTVDYPGKAARNGTTRWRVVQGTGNCCENYLTSTQQGRLLDFGGSYVDFSDDRGLTWKQVQPLTPLVNGEGTIDVAPNGDIVGIGWDPYSGDHLQAFKYEAFSGRWFYAEQPLHTPFYDREWVTVVPGPLSIDGATYPYVTFLKGGYPSKEDWLYSTDGLTYTDVSSKFVDDTLNGTTAGPLTTAKVATADWTQGNANTGLTALGGGSALAAPDELGGWSVLDPATLTWHGYQLPDGSDPSGLFQVDSAGRVHNLVLHGTSFDYRTSTDGGKTWRSVGVPLPQGFSIDQIDFRANRSAGVAAVVVHALSSQTGNDQDFAWKLDISKDQAILKRRYTVGLGDTGSAAGVGNSVRMDFETVTIFSDGRLALSFLDSTTQYPSPTTGQMQTRPALAIEQDSSF